MVFKEYITEFYFYRTLSGVSVNELLSLLEISKQALHGPLRQLVEKSLIESNEATHDRRVKQLSLTEKGADLEKKLSDVQRQQMGAIFSKFGESCEENWHQVMNEMAHSRSGFDAWISKREVAIDQK